MFKLLFAFLITFSTVSIFAQSTGIHDNQSECTRLKRGADIAAAAGIGVLLFGEKVVGSLLYVGQEWTVGWFNDTDKSGYIKHPAFQGTIFTSLTTRMNQKEVEDCILKGK